MKLVIEIDEKYYESSKLDNLVEGTIRASLDAIRNGTPLSKGHGDFIDRNDYDKRLESIWKFYHGDETIHDTVDGFDLRFADGVSRAREALNDAPTIIEADKEASDG